MCSVVDRTNSESFLVGRRSFLFRSSGSMIVLFLLPSTSRRNQLCPARSGSSWVESTGGSREMDRKTNQPTNQPKRRRLPGKETRATTAGVAHGIVAAATMHRAAVRRNEGRPATAWPPAKQAAGQTSESWLVFVSFSFRFVSLHGASDRTHTAQHPPRSPAACARHGVAACCLGEHAAAPPQSIETKRNETKQRKPTQHNTTQHKTTLSTPRPAVVILEFN
mmetsp:Transcript_2680/g.5805  ORF Transcript_2680/g.5805 Transcript_2680/m.5805 type:complete len:222 (-) Transcript_2680:2054-2719(-)